MKRKVKVQLAQGTNRHEGATALLSTQSESGERVQRLEGEEEVWRTPRVKASRSSVPGGLVLELNIDRARVTDTLNFGLDHGPTSNARN